MSGHVETAVGDADEWNQVTAKAWGTEPPLSLAQERVWYYDLLAPDSPFHSVPRLIAVEGPLDPDLWAKAMNRVVERHAILRCTYQVRDGELVQTVHDEVRLEVPIMDLRPLAHNAREAELDRLSHELVALRFDIATGPLIRGHLIRMADERWVFLLDFHHITCDGWSERVTLNEICDLYVAYVEGDEDPLPPLALQYFDYADWQRRRLRDPRIRSHHEYWRAHLGEEIPTVALPTDRRSPLRRSYAGGSLGYEIDDDLAEALRELGNKENSTLYMVMLAAFFVLIGKYTGSESATVGSPINNREREEFHSLIGYLVTRLPLRSDLTGDPSFREVLRRVKRTVLEAVQHKETTAERWPYPRADEAVAESSNYQVMFFFQENPVGVVRHVGDLTITNANAGSNDRVESMGLRSPTLSSQLDLGFFLEPVGARIFGWIEFNIDVFDASTIDRMRRHYRNILRSFVNDPTRRYSTISLLDDAETELLLAGSDVDANVPSETLSALFLHRAVETPDAVAIRDAAGDITFGQLARRASHVARQLGAAGFGRGSTVAVVMGRGRDLLVGVLAVLFAGATAMPLDAADPDSRLRSLTRRGGCVATLGSPGADPERLGLPLFTVTADATEDTHYQDALPTDVAFVFATSGSTGEPKLVEIEHCQAAAGQMPDLVSHPLTSDDTVLLTSPPGSVRLIGECFWPWLAGASVAVAPPGASTPAQTAAQVSGLGATVVSVVPTLLRHVVQLEDATPLEGLRILQVLGEPLPVWLAKRAKAVAKNARLVNSYAQTEACPALFHDFSPCERGSFVSIHRLNRLAVGLVLDENEQPVPFNIVGDVYIAGPCVARGYRGVPDSAASQFRPNPFSRTPGARMFRTGDRGRVFSDGTLEVMGRNDNRIKVHGHGVTLEEVEDAFGQVPGIGDVRVVFDEDGPDEGTLVAYVVPDAGLSLQPQSVRRQVATLLPGHMVPSQVVVVDQLQRTATNKLDRSVRMLRPAREADKDHVAPRSPTEIQICRLWEEALGVSDVGVFSGFFELGGTSLAGIRLVSRLGTELGLELSLALLVEGRHVAGMAELVDELVEKSHAGESVHA